MGAVSRGFKNVFRNGLRSLSVVLILSISIGMALVMLISLKSVQAKIESVKSNIGNTILVSPAGIRGFEGGGDLLTQDSVTKINSIDGVSKVVETLTDRLQSTSTSLQPAQDAGDFGRRQQRQQPEQSSNSNRTFTMPVMITATSDLSITSNLNVSKFDITSGDKIDMNSSDNIALLGTEIATKNNLTTGSTFKAYDQDITVKGIFDGGNRFANGIVLVPIKTLQNLSGQKDQVNSVLVQVSSIDKIENVQSKIKEIFGDKADIVSSQDTSKSAVAPLENIKSISLYSLLGSLVAGAIILFLTMVMIVRERRREIGVLKAIGASNFIVGVQFAIESLTLTIASSVVGVILGTFLSNPILKVLISNNTTTAEVPGGAGGRALRAGAGIFNGAQGAIRDLHANVGWEVVLYGVLAAIVIAILGSVIPSYIISKVRPAEVLRSE